MPFPWKSYMSGRAQDREIRKFLDQVAPSSAALRGAVGFSADVTRQAVVSWPVGDQWPDASDLVDLDNGSITVPGPGIYRIAGVLAGTLFPGSTGVERTLLYLRSTVYGDRAISESVSLAASDDIALPFSFVDALEDGEILSLATEATADLGFVLGQACAFGVELITAGPAPRGPQVAPTPS